jgi:hypothetical protein
MADEEWAQSLPRSLRSRFDGLGSYVVAILDDANLRPRLTRPELRLIQMTVFVKSLDEFLRDGTEAAITAVDAFSSLGVEGFRIGSEEFQGRNHAVMRGARLSEALRSAIGDDTIRPILSADRPFRDLVLTIARTLIDGRRMG